MMQLPMGFHEKVSFQLRSLYEGFGYSQYKMNKFEEYDLYAQNKDFLMSDSAITFLDTNGKLMALKPDVTLSIVKNSRDDLSTLQKLYYHENVYRVSQNTHSFRELLQVGLECIGSIDDYCICEVLTLAAKSLREISSSCILSISHLGLLSTLMDAIGLPEGSKQQMLSCIGSKNIHEMTALCKACGTKEEFIGILSQAASLCGAPKEVLPKLIALLDGITDTTPLVQLLRITDALEESGLSDILRFDLSAVDDIRYYNGIVFKGFVQGLPSAVLSGGQYDHLMRRMHRKSGAIGFAVYMDSLERLDNSASQFDVDSLILYGPATPLALIQKETARCQAAGESVTVQQSVPENLRYRNLINLTQWEVAP
jgi:ATP phosphoribosyltransferase regulatory subunit